MLNNNLLTVSEVSTLIGTSIQTITSWYKFKKENPKNDLVGKLPDYQRIGNRRTRYWKKEDIWKLIEFKNAIPHGRYGVMGSLTQRYVKDNFRNKGGK